MERVAPGGLKPTPFAVWASVLTIWTTNTTSFPLSLTLCLKLIGLILGTLTFCTATCSNLCLEASSAHLFQASVWNQISVHLFHTSARWSTIIV